MLGCGVEVLAIKRLADRVEQGRRGAAVDLPEPVFVHVEREVVHSLVHDAGSAGRLRIGAAK